MRATSGTGGADQLNGWSANLAVPLGLGTNTFGRTSDPAASHRVLDRFAEAGGTLVDTADSYSDGAAETILGDWLRRHGGRDRMLIATKVGNRPPFDSLTADAIAGGLQDSLRRLGVEHVELYFAHYQDDAMPLEESVAAFDRVVREGKARGVGLSNFDAATVRRWLDVAREGGYVSPVAFQPHYSLAHREPYESDYGPVVASAGLSVLPYRALGGGFLTGKYRTLADTEGPARGPNVRPLLTAEGLSLLDTIDAIARAHATTPAAVSVAWLLAQPTVVAPLVSATTPAQLDEALSGALLSLGERELEQLTRAADRLTELQHQPRG